MALLRQNMATRNVPLWEANAFCLTETFIKLVQLFCCRITMEICHFKSKLCQMVGTNFMVLLLEKDQDRVAEPCQTPSYRIRLGCSRGRYRTEAARASGVRGGVKVTGVPTPLACSTVANFRDTGRRTLIGNLYTQSSYFDVPLRK